MSSLARHFRRNPGMTGDHYHSGATMRGGNCGGLRSASLHSGPSQRFLRGLRPLVSVGPLPLPVSGGGHAPAIPPPHRQHVKKDSMYHPERSLPHHVILNEVKDLKDSVIKKHVTQKCGKMSQT